VALLATDGRLSPPGPDPVAFLTQAPGLRSIRQLAAEGRRAEARNALVRTIVGHLIHPRAAPLLRLIAQLRLFERFDDFGFFLNWLLNMVLLHRMSREWRKVSASANAPMLAPTVLFRPQASDPDCPADLGWRARCPNLTVYDVGGDHSTMLDEPHLGSLVARFTSLVAAAAENKLVAEQQRALARGNILATADGGGGGQRLAETLRAERGLPASTRDGTSSASHSTKIALASSVRAPARFISFAWGETHLERLLELALPALLAPGNLPRVAATVPCELVLLIEQGEALRVGNHPSVQRIRRLCPVTLLSLDDLVSTPDKYGMSLTYALHRGMSDLRPPVDNNFLFFLNADFIAADGSFHAALSQLMRGHRLVAAPSYCVVSERAGQELRKRIDPRTGALLVDRREMAKLALRNLHDTVKGRTVNQSQFHLRQMDQFYWRVDADTLLGHQMPVAIVAMRPERRIDEPNSYWDHGLISELCPHAKPHVLGDSDDFMMVELRSKEVARDQIVGGRFRPKEAGERMIGWVTPYQRDFAEYPLTLHARGLPEEAEHGRSSLSAIVHETLSHAPVKLPSHTLLRRPDQSINQHPRG
jgi:hypothetical protein